MSLHSFDPAIAKKAGINAAVIYQNLLFWCEKNKANQRHIYDGKHWTYNSINAFCDLIPYLSSKQIRTALDKLESLNLIESGCFNKSGYDRTKWYTCTCLNGKNDLPLKANGNALEGEPIPDSKPNGKPHSKPIINRFVKPTLEEVKAYCLERKNNVDPERFIDHYESNGWNVGKNKMKCWKAAVRTWERNSFNSKQPKRSINDLSSMDYTNEDF